MAAETPGPAGPWCRIDTLSKFPAAGLPACRKAVAAPLPSDKKTRLLSAKYWWPISCF